MASFGCCFVSVYSLTLCRTLLNKSIIITFPYIASSNTGNNKHEQSRINDCKHRVKDAHRSWTVNCGKLLVATYYNNRYIRTYKQPLLCCNSQTAEPLIIKVLNTRIVTILIYLYIV